MPRPRTSTRRLAVCAATVSAAAAGGYAAWGSGLDRLAGDNAAILASTPDHFRARGWQAAAWAATREQDRQAALAAANAAVLRDPLDPGAASALGAARLAAGDPGGADQAFRVAGQLGWRDRATQTYWALQGSRPGAAGVAALRADALLRQDSALLDKPQLLSTLYATAKGRTALAGRLALRPTWFASYFGVLHTLTPEQVLQRAALLEDRSLAPPVVQCADIQPFAAAVARAGQGRRANTIWRRYCGTAGQTIGDPRFAEARIDNPGPAGWQFAGVGGLDLRIEPSGAAARLRVSSQLPNRTAFASQQLQLEPGRYRIQVRSRDADGAASSRVTVWLQCLARPSDLATGESLEPDVALVAQVPEDCPLQQIELLLSPGTGTIAVEEVALTPLR